MYLDPGFGSMVLQMVLAGLLRGWRNYSDILETH